MITLDFTQRGSLTLSEYLYREVKKKILTGELKGSEKLPSKRGLSVHLGISVITVQNVYERLISEGYIFSREKTGYFVTPDLEIFTKGRPEKSGDPESSSLCYRDKDKQKEKYQEEKEYGDFVNLSDSASGTEKFPFSVWNRIFREVLKTKGEELLKATPSEGIFPLREALSEHLKTFRNIQASPLRIVIGAGSEYLYSLILQLLGREKIFALENPGYLKPGKIFKSLGAECVPVPLDSSGFSLESLKKMPLKKSPDVLHVSPSHHFPTGITMPVKRRNEILRWLEEKKDRWIIEDDYDSEFRFSGKPLEPLQRADASGRVIYLNTFTRTISPSFRISYMVLPESLSRVFKEKLGFYSSTVSAIEQFALSEFISRGFFEKHLIRMKNYYRNLRNELIGKLNNSLLKGKIHIREEDSGIHFIMNLKTDLLEKEFKKRAFEKGLGLSLLSDYVYPETLSPGKTAGLDSFMEQGFVSIVVNYSGLKKNKIEKLVSVLEEVVLDS